MRRDAKSVWLVTDAFMQKWRISIAPTTERPRTERRSRSDIPGNPLFHILHHAFNDSGARHDRIAGPLLAIYDVLSGTQIHRAMPEPTNDPQRKLRGFKTELSRALYSAQEAGILQFERYEVPWPFPDKEEQPPSKRDEPPKEEDETFLYKLRLHDGLYDRCGSIDYRLELSSGPVVRGTTDGGGLLEQRLPKRQQMVRVTYTPRDADLEHVREAFVIPETTTDDDYLAHLFNLGFGGARERAIIHFQAAHKDLALTGTLDDETKAAIQAAVTGQLKSAIEV